MSYTEEKIYHLKDYVEYVTELGKRKAVKAQTPPVLWFRGHFKQEYQLRPSLFRMVELNEQPAEMGLEPGQEFQHQQNSHQPDKIFPGIYHHLHGPGPEAAVKGLSFVGKHGEHGNHQPGTPHNHQKTENQNPNPPEAGFFLFGSLSPEKQLVGGDPKEPAHAHQLLHIRHGLSRFH